MQMINHGTFEFYTPTEDHLILQEIPNAVFMRSVATGTDWYELRSMLNASTVKIVTDATGRILSAHRDATMLPLIDGASIVEIDDPNLDPASLLPAKTLIDGQIVDWRPAQIRVYKAPMFRKMTDAEYEAYLQIRAGFPPRLQAIFDAAEYLSSDDEFWPDLVAAAEQAYGVERAAELLAPEG
jgi:hypothetical protein